MCNCNQSSITIPQGPPGPPGPAGATGPTGPQGPAGIIPDSGWVNLQGFSYYSGSPFAVPQVRRIGPYLEFRGLVIVPLSDTSGGTTLIPLGADMYVTDGHPFVYQGSAATGGCTVNPAGAISFNRGGSVLPSSLGVLPDGTYSKENFIAIRRIQLATGVGAVLPAVFSLFINSSGALTIQTQKDVEEIDGVSTNLGVNPLRLITANVKTDFGALDFRTAGINVDAGSTLHSAASANGTHLNYAIDQIAQTYGFDVDAANPEEIGGFYFRLDGLRAFIAPSAP